MVAWSKMDVQKKVAFFEAFVEAIVDKKGDDIPNQRPASVKTLACFLADDKKYDHVSFSVVIQRCHSALSFTLSLNRLAQRRFIAKQGAG